MKIKEQELKQQLKKTILDSYPDLLNFNNSLAEFEQFIKKEAKQEFIENEIKILEEVALDLFGKQQVRWRHTKLTKQFNDILERNSKKLMDRAEELKKSLGGKE